MDFNSFQSRVVEWGSMCFSCLIRGLCSTGGLLPGGQSTLMKLLFYHNFVWSVWPEQPMCIIFSIYDFVPGNDKHVEEYLEYS